jgi:hypothetical protein
MRNRTQTRLAFILLFLMLLTLSQSFQAEPLGLTPAIQPNISANGFFNSDRAQQGRTLQAAVVIEIPNGFHINSNRPLAKFLIPTSLKVEGPGGVKVGPVSYPRALMRNFSFSESQLSVYEGRVILRFNITIPPSFATGVLPLRARLKYQSCNEEACFPPSSRTIEMPIAVVGATDPVKRINGGIFGGSRK